MTDWPKLTLCIEQLNSTDANPEDADTILKDMLSTLIQHL